MCAGAALPVLIVAATSAAAAEPGLLAHYTFDDGAGTVVKDHSGNGHHGSVHRAEWVPSVRGHALAFRSGGSHVDCGVAPGRQLTGDMTVLAWLKLTPAPYPDGTTNWTIVDCEDYTRSGFIVRVDGQTAKLYYRASSPGRTPDAFTRVQLASGVYYQVAVVRQGQRVTLFVDGLPEASLSGDPPAAPSAALKISSPGQSFQGHMDELALYRRALSPGEILSRYKQHAAAYGKDTSWFGKFRLQPFLYLDRGLATVEVDFLGLLPFPDGTQATVELGPAGQAAVKTIPATASAESGKQDFPFQLGGLSAGEYEVRAVLRDAQRKIITRDAVRFRYPPALANVPSPAEKAVPPLPAAPQSLPFRVQLGTNQEIVVEAQGERIPIASEWSYPSGGFNAFGTPADADNRAETEWQPTAEPDGPRRFRIRAAGRYYSVSRCVEVQPSRVVVKDTITNKTAEPIGILVRNCLRPPAGAFSDCHVAGYPSLGNVTDRAIKTNPTLFLSRPGRGLGLVALDDVLIVQSLATVRLPRAPGPSTGPGADRTGRSPSSFTGRATLHSDTFALDQHASYTLEWAVYPMATGDYYDFINQVRRDEGRNGAVDGGLGFISRGPGDRRGVPSGESVELRNLKYGIIHCLSFATDDPGVSIEGIEFIDFPKERRQLKEQIAAIRQAYPGLKITFHIAHSLYATNRPDQRFADSRVIDAAGRQTVYTANPGSYFSKERFDQGWNWYIYYPTLDNSFGRAMLQSVDVMLDEIGADGPFLDGFMWGYGGELTYDRWDGHTAQIDPRTKRIVRRMGSVLLLSQDALVAYCRKVRDRGGVVIANNSVITRTIGRENYILHDRECFAGPEVHLAATPLALSLPAAIRSEPDIHRDVLDKLRWGNLYVYYEEGQLTHASVPAQMYPITFEEIHAGYVKGRERLVTMHAGTYGWASDRDLHCAYRYDARGVGIAHEYLTTVDATGVRTQVDLAKEQCAVVKRIPVRIEAAAPVNVHLRRYNSASLALRLHGSGAARLSVRSGEFHVVAGTAYEVTVGKTRQRVSADGQGTLTVPLDLCGQQDVTVQPEQSSASSRLRTGVPLAPPVIAGREADEGALAEPVAPNPNSKR